MRWAVETGRSMRRGWKVLGAMVLLALTVVLCVQRRQGGPSAIPERVAFNSATGQVLSADGEALGGVFECTQSESGRRMGLWFPSGVEYWWSRVTGRPAPVVFYAEDRGAPDGGEMAILGRVRSVDEQ